MHDQHSGLRVRHHGGGDAPNEMPREPAVVVGAEHDEARFALLGDFDDPLPGWRCLIATLCARNPAFSASDAPYAAVSSAAFRTSVASAALKCPSLAGRNPTSPGCHTHTTSASRPGASWRPACSIASFASSQPS